MRARSAVLAAVIAVTGIGVTACGGESVEPPKGAASSTASTTPSPNALTLAEAKAILEPLFKAQDNAVERLNEAGEADPFSMKRLNKAAGKSADADDKTVRVLVARDWPLEIRPEIERLINALNESQPVMNQLSETEDFDEYVEFFDTYMKPIATEVPTEMRAIRVKLGIDD